MRKTLVTIFCSALIAASSIQVAAAAQRHAERHHVRFRNSNNDLLRDPPAQAETSPTCPPGTSSVCTNFGCLCN
jgi:hypothetical protein